jgi:hypothetical protein
MGKKYFYLFLQLSLLSTSGKFNQEEDKPVTRNLPGSVGSRVRNNFPLIKSVCV